jgi:hypothetical protein
MFVNINLRYLKIIIFIINNRKTKNVRPLLIIIIIIITIIYTKFNLIFILVLFIIG